MYYAEEIIDGKLYYRTEPDGEWILVDYQKLLDRLVVAENALRWLEDEFKKSIGTGPAHHVICQVHRGKSLKNEIRFAQSA